MERKFYKNGCPIANALIKIFDSNHRPVIRLRKTKNSAHLLIGTTEVKCSVKGVSK